MRRLRWLEESLSLLEAINCGRKRISGGWLVLVFVQFLFRFLFRDFENCYYFILLIFSCSLLRICENVLQIRLEFLGKTRDDFICVVNLFGFWFFNKLYVLYIWVNNCLSPYSFISINILCCQFLYKFSQALFMLLLYNTIYW